MRPRVGGRAVPSRLALAVQRNSVTHPTAQGADEEVAFPFSKQSARAGRMTGQPWFLPGSGVMIATPPRRSEQRLAIHPTTGELWGTVLDNL
jgi:hypothetical protein